MDTITSIMLILCSTFPFCSTNGETLILKDPSDETAIEGMSTTFLCTLSSQPDELIWIKDGQEILDDSYHYKVDNSEPTKPKLHIIKVERTDKGYYQCNITKNGQKETSEKAFLTVDEIAGEQYPICETSKPEYDECETVYMTCTTENKSPLDKLEFSKTLETNTTYQCLNRTHQRATLEFLAEDKFNNFVITCIMSSSLSKPRNCSKTLHIVTKSTPSTKSLYSLPETTANSETSECECPNTDFKTLFYISLAFIIILGFYICVNEYQSESILKQYLKPKAKEKAGPNEEEDTPMTTGSPEVTV